MIRVRKMDGRIRHFWPRVRIVIVRFLIVLVPLTELGGVDPISAACLPRLEVEVSITEALSSFGLRLSSSVMTAVIGVKTIKLRCRLADGTAVHDCYEMRQKGPAQWHFRESWSPTRAGSVNSCTARIRDTFHA
ncbi:hypothetical protein C4D60_Mb01t20310 [Musa balbisiana]|uniref:Uncharacterized protein n=1 Tax=Musa balbisiana TaxID=52838 RepID=A0A4S8JNT7_MUSBA|nr:hypothetical protein C4D60_Mb01t20310 [Musa balbisiana]